MRQHRKTQLTCADIDCVRDNFISAQIYVWRARRTRYKSSDRAELLHKSTTWHCRLVTAPFPRFWGLATKLWELNGTYQVTGGSTWVTGHFSPKTFRYQRFGSKCPDQFGSAEVSTLASVSKCLQPLRHWYWNVCTLRTHLNGDDSDLYWLYTWLCYSTASFITIICRQHSWTLWLSL